ncbi:MAG TPA: histidine kinase [Acidimicrobiia bacterium]|jgi:signal transduction histidine kinase
MRALHNLRRTAGVPMTDVLIAAACAVVELSSAALNAQESGSPQLTVFRALLLVATCMPLVARRRAPITVLSVTGALSLVYGIAPYPDPVLPLALLVALFTVAERASRPTALVVLGISLVAGIMGNVLAGDAPARNYYFAVVVIGLAWVLGDLQRTRRDDVERERAEQARRAVTEERARIARELHDVVAHHVSMIVVQSEANASVASSPESAAAFDAMAGTGRLALAELRRLLGLLREDAGAPPVAPQPGLSSVETLVSQVRAAGLPVELAVEGAPRPLPAGIDVSAYRILQEALTNSLKHAGPASASVVVRYRDDAVELRVVDDGAATDAVATNGDAASGHGIVGMRERVALCGGELRVGPRPTGGYEVRALLPTGR